MQKKINNKLLRIMLVFLIACGLIANNIVVYASEVIVVDYSVLGDGTITYEIYDNIKYYLMPISNNESILFKGWIISKNGEFVTMLPGSINEYDNELDSEDYPEWSDINDKTRLVAVFASDNQKLEDCWLFSADDIEIPLVKLREWESTSSLKEEILSRSSPTVTNVITENSSLATDTDFDVNALSLTLGQQTCYVNITHENHSSVMVSFNMNVFDRVPPELSTINNPIEINIDSVLPSDSQLESLFGLVAVDDVDGLLPVNLDASTVNTAIPGIYNINTTATDSSNNKASMTLTLIVIDNIPPVLLSEPQTASIFPSNSVPTNEELVKLFGLTATDNVDGNISNFTFNTSAVNPMKPGSYQITASVKDNAGNETKITLTLVVIDNIPPIMTAKNNPARVVPSNSLPTDEALVNLFVLTSVDETDGNITDFVFDKSKINPAKPGSYPVPVATTDNAGNKAILELTLIVIDNIPPVFTEWHRTGTIEYGNKMPTNEELTALFGIKAIDETDGEITNFTFDTSSVKIKQIGTYDITVTARDKAGNKSEETITLLVKLMPLDYGQTYYPVANSVQNENTSSTQTENQVKPQIENTNYNPGTGC